MVVESAVSDTVPIIHLSEIGELRAFTVVSRLFIPREVAKELGTEYMSIDLGELDFVEESLAGKGGKERTWRPSLSGVGVYRWGRQRLLLFHLSLGSL
jgi:hypothetical protein